MNVPAVFVELTTFKTLTWLPIDNSWGSSVLKYAYVPSQLALEIMRKFLNWFSFEIETVVGLNGIATSAFDEPIVVEDSWIINPSSGGLADVTPADAGIT